MEFRRLTKDIIIQQTLDNTIPKIPFIAIVANGEMPANSLILNLIKSAKLVIACDGAALGLNKLNISPDYIVGDNDSINELAASNYIFIDDQNSNDLTKAFNFAINNLNLNQPIIIFAANGQREDHAIGNFALLNQFGKFNSNLYTISDFGIFSYISAEKTHTVPCLANQQISFFNLEPTNNLNSNGLKYELVNFKPTNLFGMTLNQTLHNTYKITASKPIIIYTSFECKNKPD